MSAPQVASRWPELLTAAFEIIDDVNRDYELLTGWTFGGGTAMMIQIDHRESHDIDLFLDDVQLLPYVEAAVAEMQFSLGEPTYNGDGTGHIKVAFDGIGEIDFIVTAHMTAPLVKRLNSWGVMLSLKPSPKLLLKRFVSEGLIFSRATFSTSQQHAKPGFAKRLSPHLLRSLNMLKERS